MRDPVSRITALTALFLAAIPCGCSPRTGAPADSPFETAGPGEPCGGLVFCIDGLFCTDGFCAEKETEDLSELSDLSDTADLSELSDAAEPAENDETPDIDWRDLCDGDATVTEANLPHFLRCDTIAGDLRIEGTLLASLDGLRNLRWIEGALIVTANLFLTDPSGLGSIQTVAGDITIADNPKLPAIESWPTLETIGGELRIKNNPQLNRLVLPALRSLDGIWIERNRRLTKISFQKLGNISRHLYVIDNDALILLDGFPLLSALGDLFLLDNDGLTDIALSPIPLATLNRLSITRHAALRSLRGLEELRSVGSLTLSGNPKLQSLGGLSSLGQVTGDLTIESCGIATLAGLGSLYAVQGDLLLRRLPKFTRPDALPLLYSIGGTLALHEDPLLADLAGLAGIRTVGGLSIIGNDLLSALTGLNGIETVNGDIEIMRNPALTDTAALNAISSLYGRLALIANDSLAHIDGFALLHHIGGDLAVAYHPLLATFSFDALTTLYGNIFITENPLFPLCAAEALRDRLAAGGWSGYEELDALGSGHCY